MIRLLCRDNLLEYAGDGYIQCGRNANCPKKKNNKVLGFDCIIYIDGLPEGYELAEQESLPDDSIKTGTLHIIIQKDGQTILEDV